MSMTLIYFSQSAGAQASDKETCDSQICHVKIIKDGFVPKTLTVKIGATVVWTNTDDNRHTVTSGSPGQIIHPFKSLLLEEGEEYEFTFEYSGFYRGSYRYFDRITQSMCGEIIVEPESEEKKETVAVQTMKVDFSDPASGIKDISFTSGNIRSVEVDSTSHSLIITLEDVQSVGTLDIILDRNLIDAKTDEGDDRFMILVKKGTSLVGSEGYYEELSLTPTERALRIVVPVHVEEIRIVGTQVIPEFHIVMAVVALMVATVITSSRFISKLR
jgi:plastocyanin